jgi:hypothetical protein
VAAPLFGVEPDWLLPANGSDENLTMLLRSFVDPDDLVRRDPDEWSKLIGAARPVVDHLLARHPDPIRVIGRVGRGGAGTG